MARCKHPSTYYGAEEQSAPDRNGNVVVYRTEYCRVCDAVVGRHTLRTERG
jgi:hypothetical protein